MIESLLDLVAKTAFLEGFQVNRHEAPALEEESPAAIYLCR
jgi:hypothetical protein